MRLEADIKLDYKDVLIRPKRSTLASRSQVDLDRRFLFKNFEPGFYHGNWKDYHYDGIPIMAANMDGVGTFEIAKTLASMKLFTCLTKTYSESEIVNFFQSGPSYLTEHVAVSIGISEADLEKFRAIYKQITIGLKYVCIDIANGYSERFVEFVQNFRKTYPSLVIIAGNVVTREMTEQLILSGADIVKVGVGPGHVCTTRLIAGVGYPQLSAVIECADAAHGLGGHIIADGGCSTPGDVAKAFSAGADFVMVGSILAGTTEGGGEVITKRYLTNELDADDKPVIVEKQLVKFYGMSSKTANEKHFGGLKDYRSSEGRTVLVDYKGDLEPVVQNILGGLRSAMTYCGAATLKQLSKCATFIRCSDTHTRTFESKTIGN